MKAEPMPDKPKHSLSPIHMGDRKVFAQMYQRYFGTMCYFASRIIGIREDARDVVEELFTGLWQQCRQFNYQEHLKAYLYRSVHHASLKFIRNSTHAKERQWVFLDCIDENEESIQQQIITAEAYGALYRAIYELPTQCGKVIRLAYMDGLKNEEIAGQLRLTVQTVKNHKQRGLQLLRKRFTNHVFPLTLLLSYFFFVNR